MSQMTLNVLQTSLLSAVAIAVVFLVRLAAGRSMKTVMLNVLWLMVLVRLVLPVTIDAPVHVGEQLWQRAESAAELNDTAQATDVWTADALSDLPAGMGENAVQSEAMSETETADKSISAAEIWSRLRSALSDSKLVFWAWISGALLVIGVCLWRMAAFRHKVLQGRLVSTRFILNMVLFHKARLNIRRTIVVIETKWVDVPVVMGIFKPMIILPAGLVQVLDSDKLRMVILHEMCHIRRKDLFKNALWFAAKVIHWFNPLVWAAYNAYLTDTEQACDEMAAKMLDAGEKAVYSEALLAVIKRSKVRQTIPVLSSFCKDNSTLRKRVENMLKPKKKSKIAGVLAVVVMITILVGCFTTACMKPAPAEIPDDVQSATAIKTAETQTPAVDMNAIIDEDQAVAIAEQYAPEGAVLEYHSLEMTDNTRIHEVVDEKNETYYSIYAYGGSLRGISYIMSGEEDDTDVGEEQVLKNVSERAIELWEAHDLDLEVEQRDISEISSYTVSGEITDAQGAVRTLRAYVSPGGEVYAIYARYTAAYLWGITEAEEQAALRYALTDSAAVEFIDGEQYYDDSILMFTLDDGMTMVRLLRSVLHLRSLSTKLNEISASTKYSDAELKGIFEGYFTDYFPKASQGVSFVGGIEKDDVCYTEAILGTSDDNNQVYCEINGKGELIAIGIKAEASDQEPALNEGEAEALALDYLIEEVRFADRDEIVITDSYQSQDENLPDMRIFKFRYTSDNPTIRDYSFTATVGIRNASGDFGTLRVDPVLDELDLLSEEELVAKARQYISEEYGMDPDDLKYQGITIMTGWLIEYQADFSYDGKYYGASMVADTGEKDGVGVSW